MKQKWKRISIALEPHELDMLTIVKKYFNINIREMIQSLFDVIWSDIPSKYKKDFNKKWGTKEKAVKRKFKKLKKKRK
ncbi:MAG: hypothetical protein M1135_01665 [Candidatus Omnitrophica bacterium]|nr:hypothetical protein [Candidatus Omnitrophota bacterium]